MTRREADTVRSRQPLPPGAGEVFDLGRHYELVRRTFYAAHAPTLAAAGLDVEDVLQRVCLSLLVRMQGDNPHDPSRGAGVRGWIRMVCRSVVSNALDQARRRAVHEDLGGEQDAASSLAAVGAEAPVELLLDAREEISEALSGACADAVADTAPEGAGSHLVSNRLARPRPRPAQDRYLAVMVSIPHTDPVAPELLDALSPARAGLTPQQAQLALLMVANLTADQAAAALGVSRPTVFRWLAAPGVREFIDQLSDALFVRNAARLAEVLAEAQRSAITCLQRAVEEQGSSPLGVSAAQALLAAGLAPREG